MWKFPAEDRAPKSDKDASGGHQGVLYDARYPVYDRLDMLRSLDSA